MLPSERSVAAGVPGAEPMGLLPAGVCHRCLGVQYKRRPLPVLYLPPASPQHNRRPSRRPPVRPLGSQTRRWTHGCSVPTVARAATGQPVPPCRARPCAGDSPSTPVYIQYNTTVTASRGRRGHGLGRGDCRRGASGDAGTLRRRRHSTPHPPVVQFVPPLRRHPTATASATLRRPSSCALATQLQALRVVGGLRASWSAASGRGCLLYDTAATAAPRCCGGSSQA